MLARLRTTLDRWIGWSGDVVAARPALWLSTLLAANGALMWAFSAFGPQFETDQPDGIDLQVSLSAGVFNQIIDAWTAPQEAAMLDVIFPLDFIFPIAYAACISAYYVWSCRTFFGTNGRRLVFNAPWIAAIADYHENLWLIWLLSDPGHVTDARVAAMSASAIAKYSLLAIAAVFTLAAFFRGEIRRVIKVARYSVISLLLGTLPVIALDQGRDLLLGLGDPARTGHQVWFVVWTIVWAFSVWYWSRVLLDADAAEDPPALPSLYASWSLWLPRIAGFLTLLVPGIACLQAQGPMEGSRTILLGWICIALACAFLAFVILRRRFAFFKGRAAESYSWAGLSWWSAVLFGVSLVTSVVVFLWLAFDAIDAGYRLGAVAILAIVAANTVFFGGIAVYLTRAHRIPVELLMLACVTLFSYWNDNHFVVATPLRADRPDLRAVFSTWLAQAPPAPGNQSPVVIVAAAEGGGIRAGYWTSLVLHTLAEDPELNFANRLFAISNVSGSSFGSAVYAGLRRDLPGDQARTTIASGILRERFLAPMVAKLVTADVLQWFLPFPVPSLDRSTAMEQGFAAAYAQHVPRPEGAPSPMLETLAWFRPDDAIDVPVLFLNSTSVQTGRRVVTSPYRWTPDRYDLIDFHQLTERDVIVSTAVHNTARFPYISAAGRLLTPDGRYLEHLVDGGYFENTGADTLVDVITYLRGGEQPPNVRFVAIVLTNSTATEREIEAKQVIWRDADSLGEVFTPFRTLLQTRGARGELALRRLRELLAPDDFVEFQICHKDPQIREAPLGWQLSAELADQLQNVHLKEPCFLGQVEKLRSALAVQ